MAMLKSDAIASSVSPRLLIARIEAKASTPQLNYDWLKGLCSFQHDSSQPPEEAEKRLHWYFMQHYHNMFAEANIQPISSERYQSLAKRPGRCSRSMSSSVSDPRKVRGCQQVDAAHVSTHDIHEYMLSIRGVKKAKESVDIAREKSANIAFIRKLMMKSSVERSRDENHQLFNTLKKLAIDSPLQVKSDVLSELCMVAQLEVIDEADIEIDASTGFYFILSGSVKAYPNKLRQSEENKIADSTLSLPPVVSTPHKTLSVGDFFGVLGNSSQDEGQVTSLLSACTIDPNCEFLLITSADYQRILQKIKRKLEHEKLDVIENCKIFADWSKQPLNKVAMLVKWMKFPTGTVLVKEGDFASYIGIIKTGECRILRLVDAVVTLPNGKKVTKKREVEMCCVGRFSSFGELSVLFQQPVTFTVVTSGTVELAVIEPASLEELDSTTLQLYKHSSELRSRKISQAEVESEYLRQEEKRRWDKLKSQVISESLYYNGIQTGVGKWKK